MIQSTPTTTKTPIKVATPQPYVAHTPVDFLTHYQAAAKAQRDIAEKYHSIDSMNRQDKVKALSDPNLNPYGLQDNPTGAYDGLSNSLHRWKTVAADADSKIKNGQWDWRKGDELKAKTAAHYYDSMIAPFYAKMGIAPMDKKLWMRQAYSEALNYNIEDSYNSSFTHGLKQGWNSGVASTARAYGYMSNALGNLTDDAFALYKANSQTGLGWHEQMRNIHNAISSTQHKENIVTQGSKIQDENHQFWSEALPTHEGWVNHATSFIAEQAAQLPVYAAMEMGGKVLSLAGGSNLTKLLTASPIGKRVLPYLMAGGEGLAYGTLTRPQNDKNQAWQDAVGFAVFHGIFDLGGAGLKKLIDILPEGSDKLANAMKKQDRLDLAQEGRRPATGPETYEAHKAEVASNLAVGGVPAQRAIFADALRHVENMQNVEGGKWTAEDIRQYESELLKDDPARWSPTLSAAKFVRSLIGDKRLSDMKPGSEDEKFLSSRIAKLIMDSAQEINTHVKGMAESTEQATEKSIKEPAAKHTLDFYRAKVTSQIAKADPAALKMMSPEQLDKLAAKAMAEDQAKAAKIAEDILTADPQHEAENIAKRSKAQKAAIKTAPVRTKTEFRTDKFGQPSVSFKAAPDYKIRLASYVKDAKAKGQSLKDFFDGMDDEDFVADLSNHFYPKALREAEVFFENQHTKEGAQNPNFLAFMYNYTHKMPKEFGQALEERLIDTMKVQKYMSGRKLTEPQLDYYAQSMYNHVDNFLDSGRWPAETNIFRSSNEDMFNSTRWQMKLLRERTQQEKKNLMDMFSGNKTALRDAMTTFKHLSKKRLEEYATGPKDLGSQKRVTEINEDMTDLMTSTGREKGFHSNGWFRISYWRRS